MDVHRIAGVDELATQYATTVIRDNTSPGARPPDPRGTYTVKDRPAW
jgi:hypothetical protein